MYFKPFVKGSYSWSNILFAWQAKESFHQYWESLRGMNNSVVRFVVCHLSVMMLQEKSRISIYFTKFQYLLFIIQKIVNEWPREWFWVTALTVKAVAHFCLWWAHSAVVLFTHGQDCFFLKKLPVSHKRIPFICSHRYPWFGTLQWRVSTWQWCQSACPDDITVFVEAGHPK